MAITAAQVNELRQKTGAGMLDCKKALEESNGDQEKAIEILRKKGAATAAKRADRAANEGIVSTKVSDDRKFGVIVEVNCETDFVAKSADFVNFSAEVTSKSFEHKVSSLDELKTKYAGIENDLVNLTGKVGEKTQIARVASLSTEDGYIADYIHPGAKLGVILSLSGVKDTASAAILAKDLAMQVAAMKPVSISRDGVPADVVAKELDIYKELARKEGKPENMLDRIAQGRLDKYFQENCLIEQVFIKDNSKTVSQLLEEHNKQYSSEVKVAAFIRYHLGDESK